MALNYVDRNRGYIVRDAVVMEGKFFPKAEEAVVNTANEGFGFSVVYSATGVFTLTLTEEFEGLVAYDVNYQLASAGDYIYELGDVDLASKTIVIRCVKKSDGSAVAPPAADDNHSVAFRFVFRKHDKRA